MTEHDEFPAVPIDRRRMLRVVGAAGAAGVLAACGGGTSDSGDGGAGEPAETTPGGDSANDQDTGSERSEQPDEFESEGEDEDGGNGQADALASTGDVPVGGGVVVGAVVVTQPAEGDFRAFSSTCTHQGCTVGDISDGAINCQCHGSRFSAEDGSVQNGPASQPLPEVQITVDGDQIHRG